MGHIFIFEDSPYSPGSMLLSENIEGIRFIFSGGADNMLDDIVRICNSDINDIVYAFADTVPDNRITMDKYSIMVQTVTLYEKRNVFVIPILCMEYFIIKMLSLYYDFKVSKDKESMYLSYIINEDFKYPVPGGKTLEKCYKDILNSNIRNCMINNVSGGNGKFYRINCKDCNRVNCRLKVSENESLISKALCLYTRFPIFEITSKEQEIMIRHICSDLKETGIKDTLLEIRKYYSSIFNVLHIGGDVVLSGILEVLSYTV